MELNMLAALIQSTAALLMMAAAYVMYRVRKKIEESNKVTREVYERMMEAHREGMREDFHTFCSAIDSAPPALADSRVEPPITGREIRQQQLQPLLDELNEAWGREDCQYVGEGFRQSVAIVERFVEGARP